MKLFHLDENYSVIWEPQALLLAPFAELFKRDKSKDKSIASAELAFVWFFSDIKSDYQIHTDDDLRTKAIKADIPALKGKWVPDKKVKDAIAFYNERSTTITGGILKDSTYVANKLSTKMREAVGADSNLDVAEITKLLEAVKKMPEVIKAIQAAERAVLKEIEEAQGFVGSKEKADFEDGGLD